MSIEEIIHDLSSLAQRKRAENAIVPDGFPVDSQLVQEERLLREAIAMLRTHPEAQTDPGEVSDGYHTFNELYHHRAVLFSVICNEHPDLAWKSKHHHVGGDPMYDGMFIVGIDTPDGQATYHYDIDQYWDMFKVKELENAPEWDGHTPAQAIERIGLLSKNEPLTLEELREMDGQPVWCNEYKAWGIIQCERHPSAKENVMIFVDVWHSPVYGHITNFELPVRAEMMTLYRHPTKEGTNE